MLWDTWHLPSPHYQSVDMLRAHSLQWHPSCEMPLNRPCWYFNWEPHWGTLAPNCGQQCSQPPKSIRKPERKIKSSGRKVQSGLSWKKLIMCSSAVARQSSWTCLNQSGVVAVKHRGARADINWRVVSQKPSHGSKGQLVSSEEVTVSELDLNESIVTPALKQRSSSSSHSDQKPEPPESVCIYSSQETPREPFDHAISKCYYLVAFYLKFGSVLPFSQR